MLRLCVGLFGCFVLLGLAVGGFESLPLCGFIYDEYLSNYFVLNMSEINMSCRLIFSFS